MAGHEMADDALEIMRGQADRLPLTAAQQAAVNTLAVMPLAAFGVQSPARPSSGGKKQQVGVAPTMGGGKK